MNYRNQIFILKALNLVQQSNTYLAKYDLISQLRVRIDQSNYVMYLSDFFYPRSGDFGSYFILCSIISSSCDNGLDSDTDLYRLAHLMSIMSIISTSSCNLQDPKFIMLVVNGIN